MQDQLLIAGAEIKRKVARIPHASLCSARLMMDKFSWRSGIFLPFIQKIKDALPDFSLRARSAVGVPARGRTQSGGGATRTLVSGSGKPTQQRQRRPAMPDGSQDLRNNRSCAVRHWHSLAKGALDRNLVTSSNTSATAIMKLSRGGRWVRADGLRQKFPRPDF